MASRHGFVFSLFIVGAICSSQEKANEFMDTILERMKNESPEFSEGLAVPDFDIMVSSNRISNRNFKATFFNGRVKGLTEIFRNGDCTPTRWVSGNITLDCQLSLSKVYIAYAVKASGHTLLPREDLLDVYVNVKSGNVKFEAHSFPNKPAVLKTFIIDGEIRLDFRVSMGLGLNKKRGREFRRKLVQTSKRQLNDIIMASLVRSLQTAMNQDGTYLPPVQ